MSDGWQIAGSSSKCRRLQSQSRQVFGVSPTINPSIPPSPASSLISRFSSPSEFLEVLNCQRTRWRSRVKIPPEVLRRLQAVAATVTPERLVVSPEQGDPGQSLALDGGLRNVCVSLGSPAADHVAMTQLAVWLELADQMHYWYCSQLLLQRTDRQPKTSYDMPSVRDKGGSMTTALAAGQSDTADDQENLNERRVKGLSNNRGGTDPSTSSTAFPTFWVIEPCLTDMDLKAFKQLGIGVIKPLFVSDAATVAESIDMAPSGDGFPRHFSLGPGSIESSRQLGQRSSNPFCSQYPVTSWIDAQIFNSNADNRANIDQCLLCCSSTQPTHQSFSSRVTFAFAPHAPRLIMRELAWDLIGRSCSMETPAFDEDRSTHGATTKGQLSDTAGESPPSNLLLLGNDLRLYLDNDDADFQVFNEMKRVNARANSEAVDETMRRITRNEAALPWHCANCRDLESADRQAFGSLVWMWV